MEALDRAFYEDLRAPGRALLAGSGLLVLLVGVNLVTLLLIRGSGRGREVAVRRALGAGSGRLIRQLVTESLVLAGAGGAAGLVLALAGVRAVRSAVGGEFPSFVELELGWGAVALSVALTVTLGFVLGLVPGLGLLRGDATPELRDGV
ncbi:MAG TPA: FtsX-like permease family protein, partial [Longimicrobiales bacterium]|nr:FtsX-like permease family protein [Longimicrobiales bacterium]